MINVYGFPEEIKRFLESSVDEDWALGKPKVHELFLALRDDPNKSKEHLYAESVWSQVLRVYQRWEGNKFKERGAENELNVEWFEEMNEQQMEKCVEYARWAYG